MVRGRSSSVGRNLCRAGQQERVEDLLSPPASQKKSQSRTLADSDDLDDDFTTPKTKKPRLTEDERLEVYQEYYNWVHKAKKRGPSPVPALREKYPHLGKNYFGDLLQNNAKRGTIFPRSPPGRPRSYGEECNVMILKCVKAQRAKRLCASAAFVRNEMTRAGWSKVPEIDWINKQKLKLGIIRVPIKLKPKLNTRLFVQTLCIYSWLKYHFNQLLFGMRTLCLKS